MLKSVGSGGSKERKVRVVRKRADVRRCLTRDADNDVGCTQQRISQCVSLLNLGSRLVDAVRLNKLCRGPGVRSIVRRTLAQIIRLSGLHSAFVGDEPTTTFGVGTVGDCTLP